MRRLFARLLSTIRTLEIYTDGSYIGNKKMGGMGLYFPNGEYPNLSIGYPKILLVPPNSQRCEMMAISYALIIHSQLFSSNLCTIYTDSEYTINSLTRYCDIWIKNGWRKTNGESVKNIDLLKPMHYMYSTNANVNLQFVRAHTGLLDRHSLNNNIADAFARKGAATQS